MNKSYFHRKNCRLCEGRDIELVAPLQKIPLTEKYLETKNHNRVNELFPIDLYMCKKCHCVQILDVIDPNILWDDFTFRSGQAKIIVEHLNDVATKIVEKFKIKPGSLIIDVGSNDGTLLLGYKKQKMNVLGVDPAEKIAQEANKAGVKTISEFLDENLSESIVKGYGKAKVVNCFNAFAHADDMIGLTKSIKNLIDKDGIFVFEVSYLVDIIEKTLLGTIIHEHLCHYSIITLNIFFQKFGLEFIDVERNPFQGGSIIGVVQHVNGKFKKSKNLEKLLKYEKENGFNTIEKIKTFSVNLKEVSAELNKLLQKWENEKKNIAGYGAARSGTTLIAEFNLGKKINYIFDDHFQKVNKYTPGDLIEVVPTKEICNRMPDITFILAWVHEEKIISNNHAYLEKGGCFISILPEIKIITKKNIQS